jgi:pyruvate dehydrogenase E2 component (dihydrolipoamide acetyltransferase)
MAVAIAMPKLGMTMEEGRVVEWAIDVGAAVAQGDVAIIIESEKAELEIEAPASGVLRHVYVGVDETVPCGTLLGVMTPSADDPFDAEEFRASYTPPTDFEAKGAVHDPVPAPVAERSVRVAVSTARRGTPVSPAARALARQVGVDPAQLTGTGPGGRVVRADVRAFADGRGRRRPVAEGVALEVPVQGDGDAIVLLPGFGCDVSVFAQQIPSLAATHRVFGINPRGVGGSDAPDTDCYDIGQTARDAAAVIGEPAHVVGASLGAAVAIELALLVPEKVRSLTLVTPFVDANARLLAVCASWARLAADVPPASLAATLMPWLFSPEVLDDDRRRQRIQQGLAVTLARVPAVTLQRTVASIRRWTGTRRGDLGRIAVPTLVVFAGGDLLTPDAPSIAAAIPRARGVEIPGAGHAVTIETPTVVTDAITSHLDSVERGAHS